MFSVNFYLELDGILGLQHETDTLDFLAARSLGEA